jgi:hypothetical protein
MIYLNNFAKKRVLIYMNKVKFIVIASFLILVGIILNSSNQFSSKAQNDNIVKEISQYKTWSKLNEKAISVKNPFELLIKGSKSALTSSDIGG